jgi:quinol monooxygenase YgiN
VAGLRAANGELSAQIFRDASDPNSLTVMNKWNSLENAQKFAHSPELKAAMEKAGVAGPPTVYFLNEA